METNTRKISTFTSAYHDLKTIEHINDLKKHNLTLAEYHAVCDCMEELADCESTTETISLNVAKWFEKRNFTVTKFSLGWEISL